MEVSVKVRMGNVEKNTPAEASSLKAFGGIPRKPEFGVSAKLTATVARAFLLVALGAACCE